MITRNLRLLPICVVATTMTFGAAGAQEADVTPVAVAETYADIAEAGYADSLQTAKALKTAVDALIAAPSDETLAAARAAWIAARVPYQQTEAFRFGNAIVDDWEGKVNAWPLDEGLIDYVDASYGGPTDDNPLATANVIANERFELGGRIVDASEITPELLSETLHEIDDIEANVATGYHAIEFLLWGQDLNGTGPGAGARPASDYDVNNCSNGHCERRADYLAAATTLLISDLEWMVGQWSDDGAARAAVLADNGRAGIAAMVTGLGSLSYGELAGERMKLGLILHDPEEEHDCFSDNTHNSHFYDIQGMANVYLGRYTRVDGTTVSGPSLADLVEVKDAKLDQETQEKLDATLAAAAAMVDRAENGEAYDQMIGAENPEGNAAVQAVIDGLVAQTASFEKVASVLGVADVAFEGSDSLDAPEAVFQ